MYRQPAEGRGARRLWCWCLLFRVGDLARFRRHTSSRLRPSPQLSFEDTRDPGGPLESSSCFLEMAGGLEDEEGAPHGFEGGTPNISAGCTAMHAHVPGGPVPSWVSACVWRLLSPPCRFSEICQIDCEMLQAAAVSAGEATAAQQGPSGVSAAASALSRWQQAEAEARQEETGAPRVPGHIQIPSEAQAEAQQAAERLLKAWGPPHGVCCYSVPDGDEPQHAGGPQLGLLGLAVCNCALWELYEASLRCRGGGDSSAAPGGGGHLGPLPPLPPFPVGPHRLLLTLAGDLQTTERGAQRRLLPLRCVLASMQRPPRGDSEPAGQGPPRECLSETADGGPSASCTAAAAFALEELRASQLPLLLHPKSGQVWALRRQQLGLCLRLLQQQQEKGQQQPAETAELSCASAAAALRLEVQQLSRAAQQLHTWGHGGPQSIGGTVPLRASGGSETLEEAVTDKRGRGSAQESSPAEVTSSSHEALQLELPEGPGEMRPHSAGREETELLLMLLLLRAELGLALWHLQQRSNGYQPGEHAHRVLQLFASEAARWGDEAGAPFSHGRGAGSLRQQRQLMMRSAVSREERQFWRHVTETLPAQCLGGHQLLRLQLLDLQEAEALETQSRAQLMGPPEGPSHAAMVQWASEQLRPCGSAAGRARKTAAVGARVLSLLPECLAAERLASYAFVSLVEWAARLAACGGAPEGPLRGPAMALLSALRDTCKAWCSPEAELQLRRHSKATLGRELDFLETLLREAADRADENAKL